MIRQHFKEIADSKISSVLKPQYVDKLPKIIKGKIRQVLEKADNSGNFDSIVEKLGLEGILDKKIEKGTISGGELQLV